MNLCKSRGGTTRAVATATQEDEFDATSEAWDNAFGVARRPDGVGSEAPCSSLELPREVDPGIVDEIRLRLIREVDKKWLNGTTLKYYFFKDNDPNGSQLKGDKQSRNVVRLAFKDWQRIGIGIKFKQVKRRTNSHIRIGFDKTDPRGNWSYVGTDILRQPKSSITMNIQNVTRDIARHEIGHTLGFRHEHQSPFSGIEWNREAVYDAFARLGWSRDRTERNVLRKFKPGEVEGSKWNPNSIMHYSFGPGLIIEPARYNSGLYPKPGLSWIDKRTARKFYPPINKRNLDLERLMPSDEGMQLNIQPGEQKNLIVKPDVTGDYVIRTAGESDALIVLFQKVSDELELVAGDNDSGLNRNAEIKVRLVRGKKYELQVRLAAGESPAVVMHQNTGHSAVIG